MRLFEVGTKLQASGKKDEAKEMFMEGYKMFTMFFALRLKIIDVTNLKKIDDENKPMNMQDIMSKLVDCCKE